MPKGCRLQHDNGKLVKRFGGKAGCAPATARFRLKRAGWPDGGQGGAGRVAIGCDRHAFVVFPTHPGFCKPLFLFE
jgi:hypothetical protein